MNMFIPIRTRSDGTRASRPARRPSTACRSPTKQEARDRTQDGRHACHQHRGRHQEGDREQGEGVDATVRAYATAAAALLIFVLFATVSADSPDPEGWSRFRGPYGSGVSTSTRLPSEFGLDKNVIEDRAAVRPLVARADPRAHLPDGGARQKVVTICLDRRSGKVLWEREAPRSRVEKLDSRNGPAGPTPATDGANVYVFFADFGLLSSRHEWQGTLAGSARAVQQPLRHRERHPSSSTMRWCSRAIRTPTRSSCRWHSATAACAGKPRALRRTAATPRRSSTSRPAAQPQIIVPGSFLVTAYAPEAARSSGGSAGCPSR